MLRRTGWAASFLAAITLSLVPAGSTRAGVLPPAPIEQAAAPAPAPGELAERFVETGMPREEASALVSGLGSDERTYLAERLDSAQTGGVWFIWVPGVVVALVVMGIMGIVAIFQATSASDAPASGRAAPSPTRAPASAGEPTSPTATAAPATTTLPPAESHELPTNP
jgi:hypothetical protein